MCSVCADALWLVSVRNVPFFMLVISAVMPLFWRGWAIFIFLFSDGGMGSVCFSLGGSNNVPFTISVSFSFLFLFLFVRSSFPRFLFLFQN